MRLFDRLFQSYPELREVIVNAGENTFRGVLWQRRGDYLVLRNTKLLQPKQSPVELAGEVVIPAGRVDFIQVV